MLNNFELQSTFKITNTMITEDNLKSIGTWFRESVLIKMVLIGFLTLALLIPSFLIQDLILERQARQQEVIDEITDKWSGAQLVQGPIMVLPYKTTVSQRDTSGRVTYKEVITTINILPETLNIRGNSDAKTKKRGIYNTVVYTSKILVNGKFSALELVKSGINPDMVLWSKAKVVIGLSDLKGLKNNPVIKLNNTPYEVETDFSSLKLFKNNLVVLPDLTATKNTAISFSFNLDLLGSNELNFLSLGKNTEVNMKGIWKDPSFIGRYLPDESVIKDSIFSASWKIPYFNRPLPQQWIEENAAIDMQNKDISFGVRFILPVDQYQKTMRTAKYAILIILLTFISLFFTELLSKKRVHLLQYILIGAAMTIYYTLLLSFSERLGFNLAYIIASVATVLLISSFIAVLIKNKHTALIFGGILSIFYTFIFVTIQLQDLALMFGSIGLFIIVAALMYLSTRIDWLKRTSTD